jgi:hypothetical protein
MTRTLIEIRPGDYVTDGARLLQVVESEDGTLVVEDAQTEAIERMVDGAAAVADGRLRIVLPAAAA